MTWPVWLLIVVLVLILSLLLWMSLRTFQKTQESQKEVSLARSEESLAQTELLKALLPLLAVKDVAGYQGVQSMIQMPSSEDSNFEEYGTGKMDSVEALQAKAASGYDLSEEEIDAITNAAVGGSLIHGSDFVR